MTTKRDDSTMIAAVADQILAGQRVTSTIVRRHWGIGTDRAEHLIDHAQKLVNQRMLSVWPRPA